MSLARPISPALQREAIPPLESGDRLTRDEFERRYRAMPERVKAELVEGVVYVASPVSEFHSVPHFDLIGWLAVYRAATPGVIGGDNGTIRLDLDNEPQPDVHLRLRPESGGRAKVDPDGYVAGAPELVCEIAASSASYDLNFKLNAYRRNGVLEYLVWRTFDVGFDWFTLRGGAYERLLPGPDGILRSEIFPGLWLEPQALLRGDLAEVLRVVQQGTATPEHAAFVQRLQQSVRKEA